MVTLTFSQALVAVLAITVNAGIWTFLLCEYRAVGVRNERDAAERDLAHVQRELGARCAADERAAERMAS